jgi:hypothetical protein
MLDEISEVENTSCEIQAKMRTTDKVDLNERGCDGVIWIYLAQIGLLLP